MRGGGKERTPKGILAMRMKGSTDYWDKLDSGATAPAGVKCFMVNVKMRIYMHNGCFYAY